MTFEEAVMTSEGYPPERNYCLVPDCNEQPEVDGELCRTHEQEELEAASKAKE